MKVNSMMIFAAVFLALGCARVRVEAPKEAIKVDISMRLDIYQHVKSDIDDIENMVSGAKEPVNTGDKQGFLGGFIGSAYAQEAGLGPEVEQAALRRKNRRQELVSAQASGGIGENSSGLVEVRDASRAGTGAAGLTTQENSDRMVIYQAISRKNGASLDEVEKLYAKRLQADAPAGTPVQGPDGAWRIK